MTDVEAAGSRADRVKPAAPPTLGQRVLYRVCRDVIVGFCRTYWRLKAVGLERVPDGPFVLAPVHRSNIDTPLVAVVTRRRLRYMGKDSLWKNRFTAWLFTALGGFPVKRGTADRVALRTCLEVLAGGEPLVVYPEGGRRSGAEVGEISEGAAYLAIRAGVPIVPVGVGGSERAMTKGSAMLRPVPTSVVVGPPIHPPLTEGGSRAPRRVVHELTEQLRAELQRLQTEAEALVPKKR
ncbi:MAG TPA: lysophospholipid acyltransferase family protein [Acidimicrobiales bacterium]|nr:lysophospholipid acyltransferase family protein [Acidimicrobiales bacterium]